MRIITGSAKGQRLRTIKGDTVRPTSDRVKESLFNILAPYIEGTCVLDLFAGSGGLGMEALSRGAESAVFVEKSKRAADIIRENIAKMGFENAQVIPMDVFKFLSLDSDKNVKYDLIFADPPYILYQNIWIEELWKGAAFKLKDGGRLILEHPSKYTIPEKLGELQRYDSRKYGQTQVSFFLRSPIAD